MQLVFLLAALCCVDASAVVIVKNTYASKTCSKSDLFKIEENKYQVGCKMELNISLMAILSRVVLITPLTALELLRVPRM